MAFDLSGSVRKTADGVVGTSGRPIRVWNATWLSGGTAAILQLRNGTAVTDDLYVNEKGLAAYSETINFDRGLLFPDGCWYDHDANASSAIISYSEEL